MADTPERDHCTGRTWRPRPGDLGNVGWSVCPNRPAWSIDGHGACGSHIVQVLRRTLDDAIKVGATSVPACYWEDRAKDVDLDDAPLEGFWESQRGDPGPHGP